ncbi:cytochrome c [Rhodanobacter soli]
MLALLVATAAPDWAAAGTIPVDGSLRRRGIAGQQLQLDHGRPWRTDASLREGMERIRAVVAWMQQAQASGPLSARQSRAATGSLEDSVVMIVSQSRHEPGADANLHLLLGRLLDADGLPQMLDVLELYPRYFDHPGWQPIARGQSPEQSVHRPRSPLMSISPDSTARTASPWSRGTAIMTAVLLATGASLALAASDDVDHPAPLALTTIMQDLGKDMQGVTDGIAHEDWPAVAKLAARIADHPQPPLAEKLRILAFVGKDAGQFRGYDRQAHDAAQRLAQAARRQDGVAAVAAFANVQGACLGCHQRFRKPFLEHFHGQR